MTLDIQKANTWKRISAWILDGILLVIAATLFATVFSYLLGYDSCDRELDSYYEKYEAQYGITFDITQDQYTAMDPAQQESYDAALEALSTDPDAIYAYNMLMQLTLVILSMSVLLACLTLEFVVPLILKNGQTLGKKIFGIALMRTDCVKINAVSLFVRTLLGKYTIEIMIPVLIIMMMLLGTIGIVGPLVVGGILLLQIILFGVSRNNAVIHDLLANTVAVDMESQRIFGSEADLIDYKKKLHAQHAASKVY